MLSDPPTADMEHLDVAIIGAGLSGIDAAYRLQTECPGKSYALLEARDVIGGTWDLFRYPGVRSDSDMSTLGFPFHPWRGDKALVDGPSIREYIAGTAARFGIDRRVRFGWRLRRANWSSAGRRWVLDVETGPQLGLVRLTCGFLFMCSGYYDYAGGYLPAFPGIDRFKGRVVHPQQWPEALDYAGKQVVVIGSGATAVTLVPALAERAAHVTMLQRSPTYIVSRPSRDAWAAWSERYLPGALAPSLVRWKNVLLGIGFYVFARRFADRATRLFLDGARRQLPEGYDVERHFLPRYKPWDQRLCLVPDGDLFAAIREGRASVVTDRIQAFTDEGIQLESGTRLRADIVVTATGLVVKLLGGAELLVDDVPVHLPDRMVYKGMMVEGVPNAALSFGYTNASWTLKCDLTARYVCRVLRYMDRRGLAVCMPRRDPSVSPAPLLDFTSGYIQRASALLPSQGSRRPWRLRQNYVLDLAALTFGALDDGVLEFTA